MKRVYSSKYVEIYNAKCFGTYGVLFVGGSGHSEFIDCEDNMFGGVESLMRPFKETLNKALKYGYYGKEKPAIWHKEHKKFKKWLFRDEYLKEDYIENKEYYDGLIMERYYDYEENNKEQNGLI